MLYLFCGLCIVAGSFLQTVTGLGLAILVMATLPFMLPLEVALTISSILSAVHNLLLLLTTPRRFSFRTILIPVLTCFVVSAIVVRVVMFQFPPMMIRILGAFMILLSLYFLFLQKEIRFPASTKGALIAGSISGIMGALFSINGPPLVLYYLATAKSDEEYLANMRLSFFFICIYTLGLRVWSGYVTPMAIKYSLVGLVAMFIGLQLGKKLSGKIRGETLRKAVYGTMILCGVIYLIQG